MRYIIVLLVVVSFMSCKPRAERLQEYEVTHETAQTPVFTLQQLQNQVKIAKLVGSSMSSRMNVMSESVRLMQLKVGAMRIRIRVLEEKLKIAKLRKEASKI